MKEENVTQPEKNQIVVRGDDFHLPTSHSDKPYLIGSKCKLCGYVSFPRRVICPVCIKENTQEEIHLSGKGRIWSCSEVYQPLPGFKVPYMVAQIELSDGTQIRARITEYESSEKTVGFGTEVELVTGKVSEDEESNDIIGYMFRPVRN